MVLVNHCTASELLAQRASLSHVLVSMAGAGRFSCFLFFFFFAQTHKFFVSAQPDRPDQ